MFKELPIHLWTPLDNDMSLLFNWLIFSSLDSYNHLIAQVLFSGLNWGIKEHPDNSKTLAIPYSIHKEVALCLVDAWSHHLPSHPGGLQYNPSATISKYTASIRSLLSTKQSDLSSWLWEIALMLKLHPCHLSALSVVSSFSFDGKDHRPVTSLQDIDHLPDLQSFHGLNEAVEHEGLLAFYIALSVSSVGYQYQEIMEQGLSLLDKLLNHGYILAVLRILDNMMPHIIKQGEMFLRDDRYDIIIIH
jgi:hypothetical protein